ncbi:hypothetical protein DFJ63DRAFT_321175 [Scheffersomyces coipomensis]|uniref:uncharacterized protein n=1 Tax=Scheffersomyces coipomensis TaxID=1788519 RepID=UPI00315CBDA3
MVLQKSIAVFGGNGLLGRKICELGVQRGYEVTSFSRSGRPPKTEKNQTWIEKVQWEKADIFDASSYQSKLSQFGTVVHLVGILLEDTSYKNTINSSSNFFGELSHLVGTIRHSNPMQRAEGDRTSYEAVQRDTAVLLADTFLQEQKENPSYIYLSADQQVPMIPVRYIKSKRDAESLLSKKEGLRFIAMRPGMMYEENPEVFTTRDRIAGVIRGIYNMKQLLVGNHISFLNHTLRPIVSTEKVAISLFQNLENPDFKGVVYLDDIAKI